MDIKVKKSYGTIYVTIMNDIVTMEENISEILYLKDEDGKNFKRTGEDISNSSMAEFCVLMEDLIYYRDREFNSSELIERLFDKLPKDVRTNLLSRLNKEYEG